jgi:hypothetical protein
VTTLREVTLSFSKTNMKKTNIIGASSEPNHCPSSFTTWAQRARITWLFALVAASLFSAGVTQAAPMLLGLSPSAAMGLTSTSTPDETLYVLVEGSSASIYIDFGSSFPGCTLGPATVSGTFDPGTNVHWFAVTLPGSKIFAALQGTSIATKQIKVHESTVPYGIVGTDLDNNGIPESLESNPLPFTVTSSIVDLATVQSALVPIGSSQILGINTSTGAGLSATLVVAAASTASVTMTVAAYNTSAGTPGLLFDAGGGWFDVQVPSAQTGDLITATFSYPDFIIGMAEAALKLRYFDPITPPGGGWHDVKNSDGTYPFHMNGPGGYFTVTFDANSIPNIIAGLGGTVFTMAPEPLAASPSFLWPPDHKMVPVTVNAKGCSIVSVSSNEPQTGLENGDLGPDWEITGPLSLNLRAERKNSGSGRIYTILLRCSDGSQNIAVVRGPHDKGNNH